MTRRHRAKSLGIVLAALLPATGAAQGRIARPAPAGPIAVTLPSPPPASMRPTMDGAHAPWPLNQPVGAPLSGRRFGQDWWYPIPVQSAYQVTNPVPAAYPVPYYYPAYSPNVYSRREPERPAPPPYNPANAKMLVIGAGGDGGGGVMRIVHLSGDTLRLTWLGTTRPISEARLFLADADRQSLRSTAVDADHREVRFALARLNRPASYAGLTIVLADGSTQTTLVPLAEPTR